METKHLNFEQKCLLDCIYCKRNTYVANGYKLKTYQEILDELDKVCKENPDLKSISIRGGGEPTLLPKFLDFCEILYQRGLTFNLETDGLLLSDESFLKKLVKYGLDFVILNFNSYFPDVYDEITNTKGYYPMIYSALKNLEKNSVSTSLNIVVMKQNVNHFYKIPFFLIQKFPKLIIKSFTISFIRINSPAKDFLKGAFRYSDYAKDMSYHIKNLKKHFFIELGTGAGSFPFCIFPELTVLEDGFKPPEIEDDSMHKKIECCKSCIYFSECPGIAQTYVEIYGDSEIKPITKKSNKKVLLLHIPNFKSDEKDNTRINVLPSGMISLSNYLSMNGYANELIHLGVERKIADSFDIIKYILDNDIDIIFCDLHWYYQTYSLFNILKEIKKAKKDLRIILGGLSATLFSKQILAEIPFVDFIIRGNSELPSKLLLDGMMKKVSINDIPNLSWRSKSGLVENKISYEYSSSTRVNYSSLDNLRHKEKYLEMVAYDFNPNVHEFYYPIFVQYGPCDKGCYSCPGNSYALSRFFRNSTRKVWFDQDIILENIKTLRKQGIKNISFVVYDFGMLVPLLKAIRKEVPGMKILVESCMIFNQEILSDIDTLGFGKDLSFLSYVFFKEYGPGFLEKIRHSIASGVFANGLKYYVNFTLGEPGSSIGYYRDILDLLDNDSEFATKFSAYDYMPDPMTEFSVSAKIMDDISKIYSAIGSDKPMAYWKNTDSEMSDLIKKIHHKFN